MVNKGLRGRPIRLVTSFDSQVMRPDGRNEPHVLENLRVTVLFWELDDLDEEHEAKHRAMLDQIFEQTRDLSRTLNRTGLPGPTGHVVVQQILKQQPQVTSICWN